MSETTKRGEINCQVVNSMCPEDCMTPGGILCLRDDSGGQQRKIMNSDGREFPGSPTAIQWLGHSTFTPEGTSSIPGGGTKIPQGAQCGQIIYIVMGALQRKKIIAQYVPEPDALQLFIKSSQLKFFFRLLRKHF